MYDFIEGTEMEYIPRKLEGYALRLAAAFPVLTIVGPRQSGKTTFVRKTFPGHGYVNLDFPDLRQLAREDPRGFLKRWMPPVIIDEIQRVPELLSYIQVASDEAKPRKGLYVLTGSHQLDLRAAGAQSLAGRTALLTLLPLSLEELSGPKFRSGRDATIRKGFMPRLFEDDLEPSLYYAQYFQTYVERDVRQLMNIRNFVAFESFIRLLAGRVGQLVNLSDLANSTGTSVSTLSEWLSVLEASFIVFRLTPYFENFGKRFVKSPKLYFVEPALAAWLLDIREDSHVGAGPFLGGLFENFVVMEALKARLNRGEDPNLHFLRDNNGLEADLVFRQHDRIVPIEIKAAMTFSPEFTRAFPRIERMSDSIKKGAVIYGGAESFEFKDYRVRSYRDVAALVASET